VCKSADESGGPEWKSYYGQTDDEISEIFSKMLPLCVPAELMTEQISESQPFVALSKVITLESQPMSDNGIVLQASGTILDKYGSERSFTHSVVLMLDSSNRNYSIAHDMLIFGEPTISASHQQKVKEAQRLAAPVPVVKPIPVIPTPPTAVESVPVSVRQIPVAEVQSAESVRSGNDADHSEVASPCAKNSVAEQATSASVTQAAEPAAPKPRAWKTLTPASPVDSTIRAQDDAARVSNTSQKTSPAPAVEQQQNQRANLPNYGASTYAGKLLVSVANSDIVAPKVTTQVVRRTSTGDKFKTEKQAPGSENETKAAKTLYASHLTEFNDDDIKRAVSEALKGGAVEGRVVSISRMTSGHAGFIELDTADCAELLLSKPGGFLVRGKQVRLEKSKTIYKQNDQPRNRQNDRRTRQVADENSQPGAVRGTGPQGPRGPRRNNDAPRQNEYRNRNGDGSNSYRKYPATQGARNGNNNVNQAGKGEWTEKA